MRTVWLWMLAACYAPTVPASVPCAPEMAGPRCPSGQICLMMGGTETCVPPGTVGVDAAPASDGPIEAPDGPPNDVDSDGIPNAMDDCPNVADPMQYDEDGDKVGDVCDPCPVSSNNTDGDGDGVGDDCDPNAAVSGDKIVLFDGLNQGLPVGWTSTGSWTAVQGGLSVTVNAGVDATITSPFTVDSTSMVAAAFVPDNNVPDSNAGFGVAYVSSGEGVMCSLVSNAGRQLTLIDLDTDDFLDTQLYGWANQTAYITGEIRRANQYACYSVDPQGSSRNVAASTSEVPSQARLQLKTRGIPGRFLWLIHIDSP
jgi:hypothetical protein